MNSSSAFLRSSSLKQLDVIYDECTVEAILTRLINRHTLARIWARYWNYTPHSWRACWLPPMWVEIMPGFLFCSRLCVDRDIFAIFFEFDAVDTASLRVVDCGPATYLSVSTMHCEYVSYEQQENGINNKFLWQRPVQELFMVMSVNWPHATDVRWYDSFPRFFSVTCTLGFRSKSPITGEAQQRVHQLGV